MSGKVLVEQEKDHLVTNASTAVDYRKRIVLREVSQLETDSETEIEEKEERLLEEHAAAIGTLLSGLAVER